MLVGSSNPGVVSHLCCPRRPFINRAVGVQPCPVSQPHSSQYRDTFSCHPRNKKTASTASHPTESHDWPRSQVISLYDTLMYAQPPCSAKICDCATHHDSATQRLPMVKAAAAANTVQPASNAAAQLPLALVLCCCCCLLLLLLLTCPCIQPGICSRPSVWGCYTSASHPHCLKQQQ